MNSLPAREQFYRQYEDIFSWWNADEYAYYDVIDIEPITVDTIKVATAGVWRVLIKAGQIMRNFEQQALIDYGYPPQAIRLIKTKTQAPFMARCDFAILEDEIRLLECNADVATFVVETFKMNDLVATHFGLNPINTNSEFILKRELNNSLRDTALYLGKYIKECNICFCSLSESDEDYNTVHYLQSLSNYHAKYAPIESLSIDNNHLYDCDDRPIDILFKLYPYEWMIADKDPEKQVNLWEYLEPLIYDKKVAVINPISSFVLQNKSLLALITDLGFNYFGEDALTVYDHFLPTCHGLNKLQPPYVIKPVFGREGRGVQIVKSEQEVISAALDEYFTQQMIYQKYVELPKISLNGDKLTTQVSCFLINGIPTGISARVGSEIINNMSWFMPLGYLA